MFQKQAFTLTIGNENSLLALHHNKKVLNKVLIPSLNREEKDQLLKIFKKHPRTPVYILLDNNEQTYTKKSYPSINWFDLKQIISRHLKQEFTNSEEREDLIYNYITHKNNKMKRWECMYVSTIFFEEMDKWVNFLLQEVANPLKGIFMLPIESVSLVRKLHIAHNGDKKVNKKNPEENEKITLLIIKNKVSGIRQIVFSNERIIFTRLTHYNHESEDFTVEYEQDVFRTNEYLKRILPNLKMEDVEIVNILPREILEKISTIKNSEINFINYTPREASVKIGYEKLIAKGSSHADLLIANTFVNSKKVLRSITGRIKSLSIVSTVSKIFLSLNALLLMLIAIFAIFIQFEQLGRNKQIKDLNKTKTTSEAKLQKVKEQVIEGDSKRAKIQGATIDINQLIEFGRLDETMSKHKDNPVEMFRKMAFFNEQNARIKELSYQNTFSIEKGVDNSKILITGRIENPTGNVETLFQIYDKIILNANSEFKNHKVTSSKLPSNIDFSKKYYSTPFNLTIENK